MQCWRSLSWRPDKKLPDTDKLTFLNMSGIGLGIGEYRPQGAHLVDRDRDNDLSDPNNRELAFTPGVTHRAVNIDFGRVNHISDYQKTLYFICGGNNNPLPSPSLRARPAIPWPG